MDQEGDNYPSMGDRCTTVAKKSVTINRAPVLIL